MRKPDKESKWAELPEELIEQNGASSRRKANKIKALYDLLDDSEAEAHEKPDKKPGDSGG